MCDHCESAKLLRKEKEQLDKKQKLTEAEKKHYDEIKSQISDVEMHETIFKTQREYYRKIFACQT